MANNPAISTSKGQGADVIWKRPAWLTAIASLITVFATLPGAVAEYMSVREATRSQELNNIFQVVNNTIAHQDEERIFMLRYLAISIKDEVIRDWAKTEVAIVNEAIDTKERYEQLTAEVEGLKQELAQTQQANAPKAAELQREIALVETQKIQTAKKLTSANLRAGIPSVLTKFDRKARQTNGR